MRRPVARLRALGLALFSSWAGAAAIVLGLAGAGYAVLSGPAAAAPASACQTGSFAFQFTGAEQCYAVPADVTELVVTATGAPGGAGPDAGPGARGGAGAQATGPLDVTPGATLYVEVGGVGSAGTLSAGGAGGFDGGGVGGGVAGAPNAGQTVGGGGGGGTSDVRTVSCGSPCIVLGSASLGSRLLVAAGGGGNGGAGGSGGAAGSAGAPGHSPTGFPVLVRAAAEAAQEH